MNNVTPIAKASRLTEQDVHEAAQNLVDSGEILSSLSLLRALGRGSLTTITKYLGTFNKEHSESDKLSTPAFTELPDGLNRSAKLLAIKVWTEAQAIANKELESQRDALQHAAQLSAERIKEAEEFSDEQAKRLEDLERIYAEESEELKSTVQTLSAELEAKKEELNKIITKYEVLKNEQTSLTANLSKAEQQSSDTKTANDLHLAELKNAHQITIDELEKALASLNKDKEHEQQKREAAEKDNARLDLQVSKQQIGMDVLTKSLEEEKRLKTAEIKENKILREKASVLEGELKAWKTFKPKSDS